MAAAKAGAPRIDRVDTGSGTWGAQASTRESHKHKHFLAVCGARAGCELSLCASRTSSRLLLCASCVRAAVCMCCAGSALLLVVGGGRPPTRWWP